MFIAYLLGAALAGGAAGYSYNYVLDRQAPAA